MAVSKLELLLLAKDKNLSSTIKANISLFKSLKKETNSLDKSLTKLFKQRKMPALSFSKSISEIGKLKTKVEDLKKTITSLNKIRPPKINIPKSESSPKLNPRESKEELDNLFNKKRKPKSNIERLANINERIVEPAVQIKNVWKEQINSLRDYTDETKKLYLAQSKFKLINLSDDENKKAFEAVNEQVRKFGLITRTEGIETLTDLHTALGNLDHAIEALPAAAKYRFSMKTLFADKFSDSQIEEQVQNAYKYLEVTGKVAKGQEEMNKGFNVLTQMTNATGGRVTPSEMLLMGRRAGASGRNLSEDGLRNLSAPIQEMGGDRTGTSLMSLYQALVGGVMKESAAAEFDRLGLIDKSKIEYGKAQKIKKLKPGANKLGDLMMTDPLSAGDTLREAMKKGGINTNDPKEISKELSVLFGNRNAQNLMDILINQRSQVEKEANLAANSQNNDQMYAGMDEQLKQLQKVENAWIDLKAKAGIPLIKTFGQLAETVTPILNFFAEHETITQWGLAAIIAGKAFSGIAQTASILNQSGTLSFFSKTGDAASGATTKVSGLGNSLKALPTAVKIGLSIAALDFTWEQIVNLRKTIDDWKAMNAGQDENGKQSFKNYQNTPDNQKNPKSQAKGVLNSLNQGNQEFAKALDPSKLGWLEWFSRGAGSLVGKDTNFSLYQGRPTQTDVMKNPQYNARVQAIEKLPFSQQTVDGAFKDAYDRVQSEIAAVKNLQDRAPSLQDPNVMASYRKDVLPSMGLSDIKKQFAEQLLSQAYPQSFAQSSQQLSEQANQLMQKFAGLVQPSANLGNQFLNLNNNLAKQSFGQITASQIAQFLTPFGQAQQPVNNLTQSFSGLDGQIIPLGDTFSGLNTNAGNSVSSINQMTSAAQGFANRVNTLQITPPTFAPITIPVFGQSTQTNPIFGGKKFEVKPFGRAKGGSMQKGHTYRINEIGQEFFTPASSGSMVSNDVLRNRAFAPKLSFPFSPSATSSGREKGGLMQKKQTYPISEGGREFFTPTPSGSIVGNDVSRRRNSDSRSSAAILNVTININGSDKPEIVAMEVRRELAGLMNRLNKELSPRMMARKVANEASRDSERL